MERMIILGSHGCLSTGMASSLEIILGKTIAIKTVNAYIDDDFDLSKEVKEMIEANHGKELIVVTDIMGGSVNNEFMKYLDYPNLYLVAGMSLPLLIELATQLDLNQSTSVSEIIELVLDGRENFVSFCNRVVSTTSTQEEDF